MLQPQGYVKDLPHNPRIPRRSTPEPVTHPPVDTEDLVSEPERRLSPKTLGICGAVVMLILFWLGNSYVVPTITGISDNFQYGQARISSFDFNVGHGGTSHFIAQVYRGHVVVIEFDQPDSKGTSYAFNIDHSYDGRVVSISLEDVNHDGKVDLVVGVEGDQIAMILYNTGKAFAVNP